MLLQLALFYSFSQLTYHCLYGGSFLFLIICRWTFRLFSCLGRRRRWHPTPVLLPGESHGQRSLVGCGPWGREAVDTTERLHFHFSLSTFMHWSRKWQPTPVFLPGESQGRGSLVGHRLWGRTESDMIDVTQQQQQLHVWGTVNSAARNTGVRSSFQISFLQIYSQETDFNIMWKLYFQFFKESPYSFPQWLHQFTFPPTMQENHLKLKEEN